jgi:hypothetical protein
MNVTDTAFVNKTKHQQSSSFPMTFSRGIGMFAVVAEHCTKAM